MNIKQAKMVCLVHGKELEYDRSLRLWVVYGGDKAEYIAPTVLKHVTEVMFLKCYVEQDNQPIGYMQGRGAA